MMETLFDLDQMNCGAVMGPAGIFRMELWRIWDNDLPKVLFIMLNPSTADHMHDDPTIRRCMNFAKLWGYGGIYVGNLFAFRATDPTELKNAPGGAINLRIGENNDGHLKRMANECDRIVFAWGNGGELVARALEVAELFPEAYCLGVTKMGHPVHPLYIKKDKAPELFHGYIKYFNGN
jgi:hypothetical protein